MNRFLVLLLLACAVAFAQGPTGEIGGLVTDSTGAVVAGAKITLVHPATNTQRAATSNSAGLYNLPALPPGSYNLKVEM